MKILMVAPTPFFADRGCHTRIYGEITGLQELGHDVLLCTYGLGRDIDGVITKRTINFPWYKKLTAGPSITKILLIPFLAITTLRTIGKYKPDVVHAFLHEGALIAKFCSLFKRKPQYIFDLQGSLSGEIVQHKFVKKGSLFYKLFYSLEHRINRWFPIITQSEQLYNQLIESGIEKSRVVNAMDSVDVSMFYPMPAADKLVDELKLDLDSPRILYMGLLEKYQGVDLLFEALEQVYEYDTSVQMLVIGFPNIEKYKALCKEKGIEKNVFFLGKIQFEKIPRYLSLSNIAVAPKISEHEGDGKLYNYMAMGMATVAFERSVSREVLGQDEKSPCGVFAKFEDSDDLAKQIIRVLDDPILVKKMGENARERAVNVLSHIKSAEIIEAFYQDQLSSR